MAVDRWGDVLVLIAGVLGLIVVAMAWPRRRPRRRHARLAHPATGSPVLVKLDTIGDEAQWRVANRHAILDVTIDIVAYRPVRSSQRWVSEPIVGAIRLLPGRSTTLSTVVEDPTLTYDVVVAWTLHHLDGGVRATRTFTVGPEAAASVWPPPIAPRPARGGLAIAFGVIAASLAGVTALAAWRLVDGGGASQADDRSATVVADDSPAVTDTTEPTRRPPTSTAPAASTTDAPASTLAATTTSSTTTATTIAASTGTSIATTTSTTTSTSSTSTTSSLPEDPRTVTISGRVASCQFGPNCLIASFTLVGFPRLGNYVCEFDDGSRFTFRYDGDGAEDACTAAASSPSITIEVDGVRSATITRDSLDGT